MLLLLMVMLRSVTIDKYQWEEELSLNKTFALAPLTLGEGVG